MPGSPDDVLVCLTTAPDLVVAERLARCFVEEQLAACVNIVPQVRSIYRWKDAICDDAEVLCLVKTTRGRVEALRARLAELHPYDVPELVALPVDVGHEPYLRWVRETVGG